MGRLTILSITSRIRTMIAKLVRENLSPRKLALTVALGISLGMFPFVWGSSLLCVAAAASFRLNHASIQIVNYLAYPLQIALFLAFCRLGEQIFPSSLSISSGSTPSMAAHLGNTTLKAIGAWFVVAPLATLVLYLLLVPVFSRMQARRRAAEAL